MRSSALAGICRLSVVAALVFVAGSAAPPVADEGRTPVARAGRAAWTTSRVIGSPEPPPPFKVVRAFPNLKFDHPLLLARVPGSDRMVVGEQSGRLYSFVDRPDARAEPFLDLPGEIKTVRRLVGAKEVEAVY